MRVLHAHRIGGIGGSERHLLALLPALAARGMDVSFFGLDDPAGAPDPFYAELADAGIPFERHPSGRDVDPGAVVALRRAVRRLRTDVLHTHLAHADVYGVLAALGTRVTVVSTKHNDDPFRTGVFRYAERALTLRTARVICITRALARFTEERVGLPGRKLAVVPYGLDELPRPWGGDAVGVDVPHGARLLLAVSRLVEQKGLDVAVRALAIVRRRHPSAVLLVLGEGPERARLLQIASSVGVEGAVLLPGRVGDVAGWYRRADVLVHPARWEGFGLALLEGMLAGLPVVASRVSSVPEIVEDGRTGILVPPDDAGALAGAIVSVLDAPGALGANGRRRARSEFSVGRMAERTAAVYAEARSSDSR